ncbi:MAG: sulfatase-like hydrolase/transferase [Bacilli bacterium]|nr:sulfatase-like hydrolase/transferase [Bacilli bacterium]
MIKLVKKDIIYNFLILLCSLFSIEVLSRVIANSTLVSFAILRILLGLIFITIIISCITSLLKRNVTKFINIGIVTIFSIYSFLQAGFHNFLGVYMSFKTSSQFGAVTSYIKDFFLSFKPIFLIVFIPLVLIILYYIFIDKKINVIVNTVKSIVTILYCLLFLVLSGYVYYLTIVTPIFQNAFQSISNKELFLTASNPSIVIDQYGTIGFVILDVKAILFPIDMKEEYVVRSEEKKQVSINSRVFDDNAWNLLINEEEDETLNYINQYLINNRSTDKNEYTGMFEGKNLIVIMMESVNDIFINPEYYPNFYKMLSNGWYFENNYSPRNSCATMNNEFSGLTSLYSIYNTCTASKYKENTYSESMFNLFNNNTKTKYTTFSAHNYTEAYYPRGTIHKNMGSGEYFGVEDLGIKYSNEYRNWSNDDDFMKSFLNILDRKTSDGENFMTWLTTVSSHQPYSTNSIQGDKYYDLTKNTNYPSDVRRYMSKLKILDDGLGVLLEGLESRGILDDTVIVLYGDHYPYGISTKNLNKVLEYDTAKEMNAERVPLVIYNSEMNPYTFSGYTTYLNLLPTLANLFNLNYDPRLYLGTDMFSDEYRSLAVFADGSWKNEKAFYDASKMKIKYYSSDEYTQGEIKEINDLIDEHVTLSSSIITNNYFEYLDEKLKEYKEKANDFEETTCPIT